MPRILVVDDDEQLRKVVSAYLARCGYDVSTAADGKEAVMSVDNNEYDLMLLDILMPEMDGLEVLNAMKKHVKRPKIITMSGGAPHLDMNLMLDLSKHFKANAVMQKPVDFDKLGSLVAELLESDS